MESRSSRPQRNRRHSRRAWPPEDGVHHPRPAKRLFTPEIKRMLKDWLIRRRENPYPSRDEKKSLAVETGLTYTQICNWFANWRRKLKNSEREKAKKSWGHLIKNYNTNARGNVEQFSISSEDSIWEEGVNSCNVVETDEDFDDDSTESDIDREGDLGDNMAPMTSYLKATHAPKFYMEAVKMEHSNYYPGENGLNTTAQCYQISSTTHEYDCQDMLNNKNGVDANGMVQHPTSSNTYKAKYKQQMMEKYLRDTHESSSSDEKTATLTAPDSGAELSKWLESAAKFRPNKNNYFISWERKRAKLEKRQHPRQQRTQMQTTQQNQPQQQSVHVYDTIHHKDELDAAEALTNLAFNCRRRMINAHVLQMHANDAIPSS